MRRSLFWLPVLFLASLLAGVAAAAAQSREEREVRALLDRFIQAANSTDEKLARQNLAEHSRSGGPFFPPFASSLGSTVEVEALVSQTQGQVSARSYAATSPTTVRVDRNLAWATYTWRAAFTFKDGTQHSYAGRATATFVREGKNWRFAHWHSSLPAPPPLTSAALNAETQNILQVERNAWEALKNKQLATLADYFTDDASYFDESQAYRVRGKADILLAVEDRLRHATLRSYQILDPQVQVLGDTALLSYYFTESGAADGKEFSNAGRISLVFTKQEGGWRALHEHRSVKR